MAKRARKPKLIGYTFTDQEQEKLADWFRSNECLYNRRHPKYKDTGHKNLLYAEKAAIYDPECTGHYKCYQFVIIMNSLPFKRNVYLRATTVNITIKYCHKDRHTDVSTKLNASLDKRQWNVNLKSSFHLCTCKFISKYW